MVTNNEVYVDNANDVGVVANGDYDIDDDDHHYPRHHQDDRRDDDAR